MLAWALSLGVLAIVYLWLAYNQRPAVAVGVAVSLGLGFPAWCQLALFTVPEGTVVGSGLDVKVGIGTFALLLYSFLPKATFPTRLSLCDYAMIALLCIHFASDVLNQGFSWSTVLRIYGEWYVPYLCGRLAIQNRADLQSLWPALAGLSVGLGCASVFEACTATNLWELVYGTRPPEHTPLDSERWGLRRAYGPCLNPIYFGTLQLLLLAFGCFAWRRAILRRAHAVWFLAPLPAILGILATGSRGPIIGVGLAVLGGCFAAIPRARPLMIVMLVVALAGIVVQRERVISFLERWSGESERVANSTVEVDGEVQRFSGTRSRLIVLDLYRIAFRRSGFLGFGTEDVTGFPVKVPLRAQELELLQRLKWIDNEYALILLRFGYVGLTVFCLAIGFALLQLLRIADEYSGQSPATLAVCLTGCLSAVLVIMLTVWMPHDYGFALLWCLGISSGLWVAHREVLLDPSPTSSPVPSMAPSRAMPPRKRPTTEHRR